MLPAFLENKHNAFVSARKQIYDYLALDDTRLTTTCEEQKPFLYRRLEELDKKDMSSWTVRYLHASEIGTSGAEMADLLILFRKMCAGSKRSFHSDAQKLGATPASNKPQSYRPKNPRVDFSPRQEYRRLSEQVIAALGGVKNYYALHVRRGDRAAASSELDRATQARAIIERIRTMVPQGETLFLLSDEKEPHYFKPLEKHWKVVRYYDFPELARLVHHPNPLLYDNNALFLVEGLVYWQARLKISSYQGHGIGLFRDFFKGQDRKDQRYLLDKTRFELFNFNLQKV